MRHRLSRATWLWFLVAGAAASVVAVVRSPDTYDPFWVSVEVSGVVAGVVGIRRNRPRPAAAWWLLLAAVAVSALTTTIVAAMRYAHVPHLDYAMTGYMLMYPLVGIAFTLMVRHRGRSARGSVLDAAVVATGSAQLGWTFILDPLADHSGGLNSTAAGFVVVIVFDLVVLLLATWLTFAAGRLHTGYLLIAGSYLSMVLADGAFLAASVADGAHPASRLASAGWLAWSVLLGSALLHKSTGTLTGPTVAAPPSTARVTLFAGIAMLGPAVFVVGLAHGHIHHDWRHALMPAALTGALMVMLLLRMNGALREREKLQRELTFRAQHDALTGLANRDLFRQELQASLSAPDAHVGLLILDLDGFKDINDTLGHPAGDALLLTAADRLRASTAGNDVLARLGGDEFAIITRDVTGIDELAARCVSALAITYQAGGREMSVTVSIGTYLSTGPSTSGEALQNADLALYAAKEAGRNRYVRYDPTMREAHVAHNRLANQLRDAVEHGGFTLHYQPVVDLDTGAIRAVEALLRFTDPDGRPVSPVRFIPVAEETGIIGPIGSWVLEQACTDASRWHAEHQLSVTVNVSGRQLRDPAFADEVLAVLRRTGLPGRALVLEITETVLVTASGDETEAVSRRLARLRAHGVRIAIDDFGTGYSSLAYLRTLPIDILKVDRIFVERAASGNLVTQDRALLRTVLELAKSLYLQPIAEGVETAAQAAALRGLDCQLAQGFLFARPVPAAEIDRLLDARVPLTV
jgi:diguanylate cyclase (GGDEF)-like protein